MRFSIADQYRIRLFLALRCSIAIAVITAAVAVRSISAPGDLDATFGQGGRVFTNIAVPGFSYFYPNTESIAVQPDGKILVCGRFWEDGVSYWYGTFIVRYMPDGSLDPSFGNNGKVAVIGPGYPYGGEAVAADMALQPDGGIVIIGQRTIAEGIIVQRYTASGTLDTTFGNNGTASVPRNGGFPAGTSIAIQPDGKIVGAGWEYDRWWDPQNYYDAIVVFRLNADGSVDTSFGPAGTGVLKIINGYDWPDVLVQPDGKLVIAGTLWNPSQGVPGTTFLARYNSDGTPDVSFGNGGRVTQVSSTAAGAALQPDGKILAVGLGSSSISRVNSDGTPDPGFQFTGPAPVGPLFVNSDGKIITVGNWTDESGLNRFAVGRLNSDGTLDTSFGIGGIATTLMNAGGTNHAFATDGAIQADGKILLAGCFQIYYTDSHDKIALIRVDGGNLAAEASISGRVTTSDGRAISRARLTLSDGAGNIRYALTNPFGYYRFLSVATGQNYTVSIATKRQTFSDPIRVIFVGNDVTNVDFVASP